MPSTRGLSKLHLQILNLIKEHPEGISEGDMRSALRISTEEMAQFGRRRRELNSRFDIGKKRVGNKYLYHYVGVRRGTRDSAPISRKLRVQVLLRDENRCQMCGRSAKEHGIALQVDHRWPREWGGQTVLDNLEALCEDCNQGKKDRFASLGLGNDLMKRLRALPSVRVRIGELLKAFKGQPVESGLVAAVADQSDWRKRTRDLRYMGWVVKALRRKGPGGRPQVWYRLLRDAPWPPDPDRFVREHERSTRLRNRRR